VLSTFTKPLARTFACIAVLGLALGQGVSVPENLQYALYCKALVYDRQLKARSGDLVTIGILYQNRYRASRESMEAFREAARSSTIQEIQTLPVSITEVDIERADWQQRVADQGVDILYIAPLRGVDLHQVAAFAGDHHLLTLSGQAEYVDDGIAIGLQVAGDHPQIIINLTAARAQGADLSSQLLKLAKVIE
jgi:hypothetical protein